MAYNAQLFVQMTKEIYFHIHIHISKKWNVWEKIKLALHPKVSCQKQSSIHKH